MKLIRIIIIKRWVYKVDLYIRAFPMRGSGVVHSVDDLPELAVALSSERTNYNPLRKNE